MRWCLFLLKIGRLGPFRGYSAQKRAKRAVFVLNREAYMLAEYRKNYSITRRGCQAGVVPFAAVSAWIRSLAGAGACAPNIRDPNPFAAIAFASISACA